MVNIIKCFKRNIRKTITLFAYHFTPSQEKKIVIGFTETANVLFNMKNIFQDKCIIVCKTKHNFYSNNHYDYDLSGIKGKYASIILAFYLGYLAKKAKYFIYIGRESISHNKASYDYHHYRELDFEFLKKHNIPIILSFLGDDIRSRKLFLEYCKSINFNTYVEYDCPELFLSDAYDTEKKKLAEQADKYATIIFSHKTDQLSYIKKSQYFFPPVINEDLFSYNSEKHDNIPIRILHAPSSPTSKGTPIVRCVIKILQKEGYKFNYIELTNMPHEEVIDELKKSHIVLNQFYTFIPGVFGLEAMATGNAVLMSAKADQFPYAFNNAWLETEDWQLYDNLKYLLDNRDKIIEYAKNGYEYIKNNFSKNAIIDYIKDIFNQHGIII